MLPTERTVVMKYLLVTRRDLRGDLWQARDRQMAEDAVEAKSHVDRSVRFWQPTRKICDIEGQIHARKSGQIVSHAPGDLNLRLSDVEASRGDAGEPERAGVRDKTAQPRTGTTTCVENADCACAGCPQVAQFGLEERPKTPIRIGVQALEGEQALRVRLIPLSQGLPYLAPGLSPRHDFGRRSGLGAGCPGASRSLSFCDVAHA